MAVPSMAPVVDNGVPGQQTPHDGSYRVSARSQQQVEMVRYQRPCIAGSLSLFKDIAQPRQKVVTVLVVIENLATLYTANNDMV